MSDQTDQPLFDVLAVDIKTSVVRIIAADKTEENAEAIVNMAAMRRGVEKEFFCTCLHGTYKDGDKR